MIENNYLIKMINNSLGIEKNKLAVKDLENVNSLVIERNIDFSELTKLVNLKVIKIYDLSLSFIELSVLRSLNKLKEIYFINCDIDSLSALNGMSLNTLYISNCVVNDIEYLNNMVLNNLYLEDMDLIDLDNISVIRNIETISLNNTRILNEEKFIFLDKVVNLSIANTGIKKIDTLIANETLKNLVIDKDIFKNNVEEVQLLKNRNINVTDFMNQIIGD